MRLTARLAAAMALTLLAACQMQVAGKPAPSDVAPLATDAIAVTSLDSASGGTTPLAPASPVVTGPAKAIAGAPPVQMADKTTPHPMPRPDATPATPTAKPAAPKVAAEVAPLPPPISPAQALCAKSGGDWSALVQSSGRLCVHHTRDSGKFCTRKSDCQGECLAQSGTCSPITPLMGCNDILQANGSRVKLCLQ
jgi:hypothetical protein